MIVKNLLYEHIRIEVGPGIYYDFKKREEKNLDDKYKFNLMIKEFEKQGVVKVE